MKSLDDRKDINCEVILKELREADIKISTVKPVSRKVPSNYTGWMLSWFFERRKDYWLVRSGMNYIPYDEALSVMKVNGITTRNNNKFISHDVNHFEIYNQQALNLFSKFIKDHTELCSYCKIGYLIKQPAARVKTLLGLHTAIYDDVKFYQAEIITANKLLGNIKND